MDQLIDTALLPDEIDPGTLKDSTAIVIDVLRASTTIVHALANGASCVMPFETVEAAETCGETTAIGSTMLAGERGGVKIEGFDLGNSPAEYQPDTVGGRKIIFTSTNGTRALEKSRSANRILIGAFVNLEAIVNELTTYTGRIVLVCAGTNGKVSAEDVLFAGSIAEELNNVWGGQVPLSDTSRIAIDYHRSNRSDSARLQAIRTSLGGQNLIRLGFDSDIETAACRDLFSIVPQYDATTNELTVIN